MRFNDDDDNNKKKTLTVNRCISFLFVFLSSLSQISSSSCNKYGITNCQSLASQGEDGGKKQQSVDIIILINYIKTTLSLKT